MSNQTETAIPDKNSSSSPSSSTIPIDRPPSGTAHKDTEEKEDIDAPTQHIALPTTTTGKEENGDDMPVHILSGNLHCTLPYNDGNSAPLTARPFALSRIYEHLVASPDEYRAVLTERLGRLQITLPQLGSDQLRQAKADIVYLKSILEDEGHDVAQIKAGAVWSSTV